MGSKLKSVGLAALLAVAAASAAGQGFGADDDAAWTGVYGYGPGLMGEYGYGRGPGMMGPYHGYGMGPGGYGMGPGMGYGMGPGMMWGYDGRARAYTNLPEEQRHKVDDIRQEFGQKRWNLMGKMHQDQYRLHQAVASGADKAELDKAYQAVSDDRKQMFDLTVEARRQIEAVVGKKQPQQ
jgi:Spy/CpxP family protein refolding chaperone